MVEAGIVWTDVLPIANDDHVYHIGLISDTHGVYDEVWPARHDFKS